MTTEWRRSDHASHGWPRRRKVDHMNRLIMGCCAAAVTLTALAASSPALAQDTVVVGTRSEPAVAPERAWGPNAYLLRSGLFTLGLSYAPALVVAIESDRDADEHLYIPVAGPWLDLANRGDCDGDCDGETVNKVLLVTDGIFQGLGALQIVASLVFPDSRAGVTVVGGEPGSDVSLSLLPARFAGGQGLMAVGEF